MLPIVVWHPHKKSNKDKIEKVQRRAARFVSNNFRRKASVSEMLHNLGWQSLDSRRQDQRLVLFYKIIITGLRRLKRRTSSRQPTPVQGRITASNSNTSRQIVIHIVGSGVTIFKSVKKKKFQIFMKFEHFKGFTLNLEVPQ